MKTYLTEGVTLVGLILVIWGIYLFTPALALIASGVALISIARQIEKSKGGVSGTVA